MPFVVRCPTVGRAGRKRGLAPFLNQAAPGELWLARDFAWLIFEVESHLKSVPPGELDGRMAVGGEDVFAAAGRAVSEGEGTLPARP